MNVFADDRDLDPFLRAHHAVHKFAPAREVRLRCLQMQKITDQFIQSLVMQQ